ncbi:GumC family protein [Chroococcidiopsis thermalis]|uniref:non-specific protein-tyrosine kinase n=1 Tax=Chroococcidiopsis thermalis (strain PCC 7203) TaxID=251229 RepID=K9U6L7_CHRTP|nr:polysaccharide biosynthesis tyrosine autokinase [Chroococcidiopsis thermalis]AFY90071.1 capsular exopolysaccharide family [Chroococcidiopsis thermalis PCC 7203]
MQEQLIETSENLDLDFSKLWIILKRRWLPGTGVFTAILGLAIIAVCLQKPVYEATGKLIVKKNDQTAALTGLGQGIGDLEGLNLQSNPVNTEIEVVRSIPLLQKTIAALNLKDDRTSEPLKPADIIGKLKLKNIGGTDVMQVTYKSISPDEAAAVVNKLMNVYLENNIQTNRVTATAAGDFIAKQIPDVEARVRRAESALRRFKEQNHLIALEVEAQGAVTVIQTLEGQIAQVRAELANANTKLAKLRQQVGMDTDTSLNLNALNQARGVQRVLTEYQKTEAELAQLRTRYAETYPGISNLKQKRTALKALLSQRISQAVGKTRTLADGKLQIGESKQKLTEAYIQLEVERLGLASRLASLSGEYNLYKQRANILPKLEQQQRELERQLKAAQSTYEILLQKLQEVRVAENQNMGNARIIESALAPEKALLFKPMIILAAGILLSVVLSSGTVAVLEIKDTSVKTLKEARELFGYTFLGAIPSLTKKAAADGKNAEATTIALPVRDTPRAPIAEAFRMLQANLKFSSSDKLKVILVTSSVPGEGKSTVSANLGAAIAQLGNRVLIVDADMRRPRQHHIWEKANTEGLSDAIVGQVDYQSAIKEVLPKLHILTAGATPPNPVALLDSVQITSLIDNFAKSFDFVIIDAPPVLVAADALMLGKITDGLLMVARPGVVSSNTATTAKDLLQSSGQKVLGLVVNGVILENESDSYYYYVKDYYMEEDSTNRQRSTANRKAAS